MKIDLREIDEIILKDKNGNESKVFRVGSASIYMDLNKKTTLILEEK